MNIGGTTAAFLLSVAVFIGTTEVAQASPSATQNTNSEDPVVGGIKPLQSQFVQQPVEAIEDENIDRRAIQVRAAADEIRIDGLLDESSWLNADIIDLPYETAIGDNAPAPVATRCQVTFDQNNLYFGCVASDPNPDDVRAFLTDRDQIGDHDRIAFIIDPFNDSRRAFEFQVSALGIQGDRSYSEQNNRWDASWDAIWNSAATITDDGFVVEAAIPFRSLRFPSQEGAQEWGFFFTRNWPRSQALTVRSHEWDQNDACLLCQIDLLTGIEGVAPGLDLQVTPTLTTIRSDTLRTAPGANGLASGAVDGEPGVDLRWNITPRLTLNSTVNPDFSQVEADVPQLEVNRRFALFFPEKRAFFLEGADLFQTPMQAFFSRTIVSPSFGTKVTGKSGSNAFGLVIATDPSSNLTIPGNQGSQTIGLDNSITTIAGRWRRDLGDASNVGALYTSRIGDGYSNHVAAADAFVRFTPTISGSFQVLHSETNYPGEIAEQAGQKTDSFGGNAFNASVNFNTRSFGLNAFFTELDDSFRADAGFISRVDFRNIRLNFNSSIFGSPGSWLTRAQINGGVWRATDQSGTLNDEGVWTLLQYDGPRQITIWTNPFYRREQFGGKIFHIVAVWNNVSIRPTSWFQASLNTRFGDEVDFTNAEEGKILQLSPRLSLRIGRGLDLNLSHTFQRLSRDGKDIFTAQVAQLRTVYNFSNRARIRTTLQYRKTEFNPEMNPVGITPESENLFSELLLSYKVNPLTVLFIGYSEGRRGSLDADLERQPLTQSNRTFFLKVGYAWRP